MNACTQLPKTLPTEKDKAIHPPSGEVLKPKTESGVLIYDILTLEAQKFVIQGNYQDALFIYNQAYTQANESQKIELVPRIEALLTQTPSMDIEEFMTIENISIPIGLLEYWLGWNLAFEENTIRAKQVLESFIQDYPDHRYFLEATDLITLLNTSTFKRDTIGCLLPLSGKYAIFGKQALAGIQLAIQDLSQKYSKNFQLIIEDTKADPTQAVEGVNRLHKKNVSAIIGPLLPVKEAGLQAQELGIPMIALTQKEKFPDQGDYLFSNFITPQMQVQTLGSYLFGELGIEKVAILYPDEQYGKKYMNLFWDIADEYDAQIVGVESYDGKKTDFSTALEKLSGKYYPLPDFLKVEEETELIEELVDGLPVIVEKVENKNARHQKEEEEPVEIDFQALFIPDSPSQVKLILPQLAFNDIRGIYLVGTNLWHHESMVKRDIKGYNRNAIIADGYFDQSKNSETIRFTQNFVSLFNRKPKFLEAIAYDTATILFSTAMDESIDSQQQLKTALQGGHIYEGATGLTVFDEKGHAHRRLFLVTIKKNKFVEINH